MRRRIKPLKNKSPGRADPFGLLVLAVLLAVSLTMVVQAQWRDPVVTAAPATASMVWAATAVGRR